MVVKFGNLFRGQPCGRPETAVIISQLVSEPSRLILWHPMAWNDSWTICATPPGG